MLHCVSVIFHGLNGTTVDKIMNIRGLMPVTLLRIKSIFFTISLFEISVPLLNQTNGTKNSYDLYISCITCVARIMCKECGTESD